VEIARTSFPVGWIYKGGTERELTPIPKKEGGNRTRSSGRGCDSGEKTKGSKILSRGIFGPRKKDISALRGTQERKSACGLRGERARDPPAENPERKLVAGNVFLIEYGTRGRTLVPSKKKRGKTKETVPEKKEIKRGEAAFERITRTTLPYRRKGKETRLSARK